MRAGGRAGSISFKRNGARQGRGKTLVKKGIGAAAWNGPRTRPNGNSLCALCPRSYRHTNGGGGGWWSLLKDVAATEFRFQQGTEEGKGNYRQSRGIPLPSPEVRARAIVRYSK